MLSKSRFIGCSDESVENTPACTAMVQDNQSVINIAYQADLLTKEQYELATKLNTEYKYNFYISYSMDLEQNQNMRFGVDFQTNLHG